MSKRAAKDFEDVAPSSKRFTKKIRFSNLEDPVNFEKDVDSALEYPARCRNHPIKIEEYESDSSDDKEEGDLHIGGNVFRVSRNKDENDDIFSVAGSSGELEEIFSSRKTHLKLGDIQGQEFCSPLASENESEGEDGAARRKKVAMGYELSSFNMREEMEEGKFTEEGDYVRTVDPHGVHDRWMDDISEKDMQRARRLKRHRDKIQRERMAAEEKVLEEIGGKGALEKELLTLLKKGETVIEALQRLGKAKQSRLISKGLESSDDTSEDQILNSTSNIEQIAHLASYIMSLGETDIYSKTYEELVHNVRSSGIVNDCWDPPSADICYEYKWKASKVGDHEDVFGPFSEGDMKKWLLASYFGQSGENVEVRCVGGLWGDWHDVIQ